MPFRVPGLDVIDLPASLISWPRVRQSVPSQKGAEMLRLKDPILTESSPPEGIDLPTLREPESLEMSPPYVASAGVTVMTSKELADAAYAAIPP
jgi:hypothetical protein